MSTRSIMFLKNCAPLVLRADNFTAICEPINITQPYRPLRLVTGLALLLLLFTVCWLSEFLLVLGSTVELRDSEPAVTVPPRDSSKFYFIDQDSLSVFYWCVLFEEKMAFLLFTIPPLQGDSTHTHTHTISNPLLATESSFFYMISGRTNRLLSFDMNRTE
jgi:hypothetical protein